LSVSIDDDVTNESATKYDVFELIVFVFNDCSISLVTDDMFYEMVEG
jgi:hypothetical protein